MISIQLYKPSYRKQILEVWEASVLATHHFLKPDDFESIKTLVHSIDFTQFQVYCLVENETVAGFIGIADKKVEMLFLSPTHFGKGLGKKLMLFAMTELLADIVDVNEQNEDATGFYKKLGFEVYDRSEKDDQGNDYPILRMKLA